MAACPDCGDPVAGEQSVRCGLCTGRHNAETTQARHVSEYLHYRGIGFTPEQARRMVGVSIRTIYRWRERGLIP